LKKLLLLCFLLTLRKCFFFSWSNTRNQKTACPKEAKVEFSKRQLNYYEIWFLVQLPKTENISFSTANRISQNINISTKTCCNVTVRLKTILVSRGTSQLSKFEENFNYLKSVKDLNWHLASWMGIIGSCDVLVGLTVKIYPRLERWAIKVMVLASSVLSKEKWIL